MGGLTWRFARAGHPNDITLVLGLHLLLHLVGQFIHLVRLVGALELPVPILAAQVAVLIILQRS